MAFRLRVLATLRDLHRAKREVFDGDSHALKAATLRIREEFRKNASETDPAKIEEAIVVATDVAKLLRTSVVQLRQKNNDTFEVRLRKTTVLPDDITPFDSAKEILLKPRQKKCSTDIASSS